MTDRTKIEKKIRELEPWFHNIHLPGDIQTAPTHFLGDFPAFKWEKLKDCVPQDMRGSRVLDIGCNAGYYSFEMAKRGATVVGIDLDSHYLNQAKWLAEVLGLSDRVTFQQLQVYDLTKVDGQFDLVIFMGLFYHLRYPLLAMDIVSEKVRGKMIFQTLMMPGKDKVKILEDYQLNDRKALLAKGWPKMAFIEKKFAGDPSNWWVANEAAILAMARTCGMELVSSPMEETYIFQPDPTNPANIHQWNYSEYLSAIGKDWSPFSSEKTSKK